MEETFVACQHLGLEIYVFKNKLSFDQLEYFCPPKFDRSRPPITIIFKGKNFLNGHFMALIPKESNAPSLPS